MVLDNKDAGVQNVDQTQDWRYYDWYKTNGLILKEYFEVSNYISSVKKITRAAPQTILLYKSLNQSTAREEELEQWSSRMEDENFQDLYSSGFIKMWSAFEAGLENIIAKYIEHDRALAETLMVFTKVRLDMSLWPWRMDERLRIAAKLERRSAEGPPEIHLRLARLFSYVDIVLGPCFDSRKPDADRAGDLGEANRIRNIILHRYGIPDETDISLFPNLEPWLNQNIPISLEMFNRYYMAIIIFLRSVRDGIERRIKQRQSD